MLLEPAVTSSNAAHPIATFSPVVPVMPALRRAETPMAMLLDTRLEPASIIADAPIAVLLPPLPSERPALEPTIVLWVKVVFVTRALSPMATLRVPVVVVASAARPTDVLVSIPFAPRPTVTPFTTMSLCVLNAPLALICALTILLVTNDKLRASVVPTKLPVAAAPSDDDSVVPPLPTSAQPLPAKSDARVVLVISLLALIRSTLSAATPCATFVSVTVPVARKPPVMSSATVGAVLLIPTNPAERIVMTVFLLARKLSLASAMSKRVREFSATSS